MGLLSLVITLLMLSGASAKVYKKCDLAKELENTYKLPRSEIKYWVCIAEYESSFNTKATHKNTNGSTDYGIFQINSRYWCKQGTGAGLDCNINCSALIDDSIADDLKCAKVIYKRHKYDAWYAYKNKCSKINLDTYIAGCW